MFCIAFIIRFEKSFFIGISHNFVLLSLWKTILPYVVFSYYGVV